MLETFRQHANSLFSKILYGMIALAFIAYFGVSFARRYSPGGPSAPVAKVNGDSIPLGEFSMTTRNQTEKLEKLVQGPNKTDLTQMIEAQTMQRLIADKLFAQEAHRLGLRVTDVELANEIRGNPAFQKDGTFNESYYLDQFKPFYEREYGQDYEEYLRESLVGDKLKDVLGKTAVISQQDVSDQLAMEAHQLNVKQYSVTIADAKNKDSLLEARNTVKKWIDAQKSGAKTESQPSAVEQESGLKSLKELQLALGQEDSLQILACLTKIKAGETCPEPYQIKNSMIGVKLIERKDLSSDPTQMEMIQQQLDQGRKNLILTAVKDLLVRESKIETYRNVSAE